MNDRTLTILATIFTTLTVVLSGMSANDRVALELPWVITAAPSIFFVVAILIPYAAINARNAKNQKDKESSISYRSA